MNRVFIRTYGCQMNERDSEAVACKLQARGYEIVNREEIADVVLLNTCSVREQAERKAIGKAHQLANRKKKDQKFIFGIMGCMAQNRGEELLDILPDIDLVVGTQKFHRVPEHLDFLNQTDQPASQNVVDLNEEESSQNEIREHFDTGKNKVTAFVSIMQGCNMRCSFCIVPKTRGKERYRSIESIVEEVEQLVEKGVSEVTLLGQIVNAYGRGSIPRINGKSPFVQLLEKINSIDGLSRIRFTSPHPTSFGDDLIECYASLSKVCEYAHLPMQSGSDRILKLMRRRYNIEKYLNLVERIRDVRPSMSFSSDFIVGFPGETDVDFQKTMELINEVKFDESFSFIYSPRPNTTASDMADDVTKDEKKKRLNILQDRLNQLSFGFSRKKVGSIQNCLVYGQSKRDPGQLQGRTICNRIVNFPSNDIDLVGRLININIKEALPNCLRGNIHN